LDCKANVTSDKVRKHVSGGAASSKSPFGSAVDQQEKQSSRKPGPRLDVASSKPISLGVSASQPESPMAMPRGASAEAFIPEPRRPSITPLMPGAPSRFLHASAQEAPAQLLRVSRSAGRWHYEVCAEGVKLLESHKGRRIAVTSVCGLHGSGKSFLLNHMLERVQRGLPQFKVASGSQPCTSGVWIWGAIESEDLRNPLMVFLDCEGYGGSESDRGRDAQLMTLCALLSSVMVLNTKGSLDESIFNSLSMVCRFAEHIEERGNELNRPSLMWVLRDFMLDLRDPSGRGVSAEEYLEKSLHAAPEEQEPSQAARDVRQSMLRFFGHRSCHTLVRPVSDAAQLAKLDQVAYLSLRSEFRVGLEALRAQLLANAAATPKTIAGQPLSCVAFVALLRQLVQALNESRVLSVKGAWEGIQHTTCGRLADELRDRASETLHSLAQGQASSSGAQLPMTDEALRLLFKEQRRALKTEWEQRSLGDEVVRREYWKELKESLDREEKVIRQSNARIGDQKLMAVFKSWETWLDDDAAAWQLGDPISRELGQIMEQVPSTPLSRTARAVVDAAGRRVAAVRAMVAAEKEQSAVWQQRAMEFGESATQKEASVRSQLDSSKAEILDLRTQQSDLQGKTKELETTVSALEEEKANLQSKLKQAQSAEQAIGAELQASKAELQARQEETEDVKTQLQTELGKKLEEANNTEQAARLELQAKNADLQDAKVRLEAALKQATVKEQTLQNQLDAAVVELRESKVKFQEQINKALQNEEAERTRSSVLQAKLDDLRDNHERLQNQLRETDEKVLKQSELHQAKASELQEGKALMQGQLSQVEKERQNITVELQTRTNELQDVQSQLKVANANVEAARVREHEVKAESRELAEKEMVMRGTLEQAQAAVAKLEAERLADERLKIASLAAVEDERKRLEAELDRERQEAKRHKERVLAEQAGIKDAHERTRAGQIQVLHDTQARLEEEQRAHTATRREQHQKLVESERNVGVLEGQVKMLTDQTTLTQQKVQELQECLQEAEARASKMDVDLKKGHVDLEQATRAREEAENKLQERLLQEKHPKCGCTLQ